MKLYSYLLYKMHRFQKTSRIRRGWFRTISDADSDAAFGMTMPFFGWIIFTVISFLYLAKRAGFPLRSTATELMVGGGASTFWLLFIWLNYKLLHSERYKAWAKEFANYSAAKRSMGSLVAFLLMFANVVGALVLTASLF